MDGVISDTQSIHSQIERDMFKKVNIDISPREITKTFAGTQFFKDLLAKHNKQDILNDFVQEKAEKFYIEINRNLKPVEGSIELIKYFHGNKIPMAVVSGSNTKTIKQILKKLNISQYFEETIGSDVLQKGKPDPEGFLKGSQVINIAPENCLVIEDGIPGMQSAQRAGMHCLGLVKDLNYNYPTKVLTTSLKNITLDQLNQWFS